VKLKYVCIAPKHFFLNKSHIYASSNFKTASPV